MTAFMTHFLTHQAPGLRITNC